MTYGTNGAYTNVSGATGQVPGNVVQSATWNAIHSDYATALTQVMQQLISTVTDRNILSANGSFEVWQRGAGSSASIAVAASNTSYTADRWYLSNGANQAMIVSAQAGLVNGSNLSAKVIRNSGQTGVTAIVFAFPLDTDELVRMRGNKVTLQFSAKSGTNWSPTSGTLTYNLYVGTGAVGKRNVTPYTGETNPLTGTAALTATATAFGGTSSVIVPTTTTQAELQFTWTPVGTAGGDDSFTIDDVSLEVDLSASTWTTMGYDRISFDMQLMKCKRHFQKTFDYSTAPAQNAGLTNAIASVIQQVANRSGVWVQFPVEMRIAPSITTYSPSGATANWVDQTTGASLAVTVDTTAPGTKAILIFSATATTVGDKLYIQAQYDAGI